MGLVVDADVLINLERRGYDVQRLPALALHEPVVLSAITASELLVGVERADTEQRRERRSAFVEAILAALPILPFTVDVARVHARLAAALLLGGKPIGAHDLIVAATAVQADYGVLTANVAEFERVSDLRVLQATF